MHLNIAFLGLGAMGSRMASQLLQAGHRVRVWNRSAVRSEPLRALGAEACSSIAQAARQQMQRARRAGLGPQDVCAVIQAQD